MTQNTIDNMERNYKNFLRRAGKVVYYIFICWMVAVSIAGVYKVFSDKSLKKDNYELKAVLDEVRKSQMYDIEVNQLNQVLGNKYNVTLYFTTNPGPFDTREITILARSGDNSDATKKYWKGEKSYKGYDNLNSRVIKEGVVYIPEIKKDNTIFIGDAKRDIIKNGTNSVYAQLIKVDSLENAYILSLSSKDSIDVETAEFYFSTRQTVKNIREIIGD